jgi:poly-gamma-glutamate system protein
LVAALAVVGLVAVEVFPSEEQQPHYAEKMLAARKAQDALDVIRDASERRGLPLRPKTDPSASRMIGEVLSPITSGSGSLVSKQTSVNPNFAAVVVQWLKDLRIKSGDVVAVGVSGSFPSMNVAVYSALHELGVEPIIISSTAASQWGANDPNFTWLDMEAALRKNEVFPYKSVAASLGGVGDDAIGLTKRGRRMLERAIERNEMTLLADIGPEKARTKPEVVDDEEGQPAANLALVDQDRVRERMRVYYENAGDRTIKAYVNVGGGTVSVGTKVGKRKFMPGVNLRPPKGDAAFGARRFPRDGRAWHSPDPDHRSCRGVRPRDRAPDHARGRDGRRFSEASAESLACWHRVGPDPAVAFRGRQGPLGHSHAAQHDSPGEHRAAPTASSERVCAARRQE